MKLADLIPVSPDDEAAVREMLGPLFSTVFPMLTKPDEPLPWDGDDE